MDYKPLILEKLAEAIKGRKESRQAYTEWHKDKLWETNPLTNPDMWRRVQNKEAGMIELVRHWDSEVIKLAEVKFYQRPHGTGTDIGSVADADRIITGTGTFLLIIAARIHKGIFGDTGKIITAAIFTPGLGAGWNCPGCKILDGACRAFDSFIVPEGNTPVVGGVTGQGRPGIDDIRRAAAFGGAGHARAACARIPHHRAAKIALSIDLHPVFVGDISAIRIVVNGAERGCGVGDAAGIGVFVPRGGIVAVGCCRRRGW